MRNARVEPRGAKLAAQIFEADDGSSFVGATFDVAAKQACTPSWVLGVTDDYRCYPIAPGGYDSCTPSAAGACEGDLFAGYIAFCAPPPFTRAGATSCGTADPAEMPTFESDLVGSGRIRLVVTHASDDKRPLMEYDIDVHRLIYRAAENPHLEETLVRLDNLATRIWCLVLERLPSVSEHIKEHVTLLEAIVAKDADRAAELAASHVEHFEEAVRAVL